MKKKWRFMIICYKWMELVPIKIQIPSILRILCIFMEDDEVRKKEKSKQLKGKLLEED